MAELLLLEENLRFSILMVDTLSTMRVERNDLYLLAVPPPSSAWQSCCCWRRT